LSSGVSGGFGRGFGAPPRYFPVFSWLKAKSFNVKACGA